jgi:hypothetical protein
MSDFRKAKLLRDEAIQDAVEMILAANHAHLDGPYTRVEVSVYNGDDSRACNRLALLRGGRDRQLEGRNERPHTVRPAPTRVA